MPENQPDLTESEKWLKEKMEWLVRELGLTDFVGEVKVDRREKTGYWVVGRTIFIGEDIPATLGGFTPVELVIHEVSHAELLRRVGGITFTYEEVKDSKTKQVVGKEIKTFTVHWDKHPADHGPEFLVVSNDLHTRYGKLLRQ